MINLKSQNGISLAYDYLFNFIYIHIFISPDLGTSQLVVCGDLVHSQSIEDPCFKCQLSQQFWVSRQNYHCNVRRK
jgi:hypothetical protein